VVQVRTFCKIGGIWSFFWELSTAGPRPGGRWLSGTRMGLWRLIAFFFWDLPITFFI